MKTTKGCLEHYFDSDESEKLDDLNEITLTEEEQEDYNILEQLVSEGYLDEEDLQNDELIESILVDEGVRSMARTATGAAMGYGASTVAIMAKMRGYNKQIKMIRKQMEGADPKRKATLQDKINNIQDQITKLQAQKGKIKAAATVAGAAAGRMTYKHPLTRKISNLNKQLEVLQKKNASKEELKKVQDQISAAKSKARELGILGKIKGFLKGKK